MELKITSFFMQAAPMDYSASMAEIGQDAGRATWNAAIEDAPEYNILDTDEKRAAFREFVKASGGWEDEEVEFWTEQELNALLLQWVAGDMREPVGFELGPDATDETWKAYEQQAEAGQVSGRLFKGTDGEIYFCIGW